MSDETPPPAWYTDRQQQLQRWTLAILAADLLALATLVVLIARHTRWALAPVVFVGALQLAHWYVTAQRVRLGRRVKREKVTITPPRRAVIGAAFFGTLGLASGVFLGLQGQWGSAWWGFLAAVLLYYSLFDALRRRRR